MKYLKMAEGVAGLFGKKVEVVMESLDGKALGNYKVEESLIPETFNKPLIIEMEDRFWRIIGAKTIREKSILRSRKVSLRVVEASKYKDENRFLAPTFAHPYPRVNTERNGHGNLLFLTKEEWRQFEFLPSALNAVVQEELNAIERVLSPDVSPDPLLGYVQVHYRTLIGNNILQVPLEAFCSLLRHEVNGYILMEELVIADSFVISTDNNTYYGICREGIITELCINIYESVDDEFMLISSTFDLVLADWCNATCIFFDLNGKEETPISDPEDNMSII